MNRPEYHGGAVVLATAAVKDSLAALKSMPLLFATTFGACLVVESTKFLMTFLLPTQYQFLLERRDQIVQSFSFWQQLLWNVSDFPLIFARAVVLAPLAVAVHRFVLLGDVTPGPMSVAPAHTRRFIAWAIVFQLIPASLGWAAQPFEHSLAGIVVLPLAFVATAVVCVRLTMIFPAIAIESINANWNRIWEATRHRFWRITLAFTSLFGPILAAVVGLAFVLHGGRISAPRGEPYLQLPPLIAIFLPSVTEPVFAALGAALASGLYWSFSRPAAVEAAI